MICVLSTKLRRRVITGLCWPLGHIAIRSEYIGSYIAVMGGLDLLIFTGGIGQGSSSVRSLPARGWGTWESIDERRTAKLTDLLKYPIFQRMMPGKNTCGPHK